MFGSSRLVRVADALLGGKKVPVHSNRGLAGIDGTIATAIGMALAAPAGTGTVRVLLGDLAALHDVSSLFFGVGEPRPRVQLIIGNDGGGTIFDTLEVAQRAPSDAFDRVQFTPQNADFAAIAAAAGWQHTLVSTRGGLSEALTAPMTGPSIIEVPLPR
ncbi:MAG: thiamine pyrophosphate-dependent enzyme, partial [Microterricola sp.]